MSDAVSGYLLGNDTSGGTMGDVTRARVLVSGRVQGVYFRESARAEALRLGLSGWVRNLADGRVEGAFEGDAASVAAAVAWCRSGPPRALVTGVEVITEDPEGRAGFEILRS